MIVLEKDLSQPYEPIDIVTTPDGNPVAMVHCNNCTSDLNAWVSVFKEFQALFGVKTDMNELYGKLYEAALTGDADCGGLVSFNFISGEPVVGLKEGHPMVVRKAQDHFTLANLMRSHLYASVAVLKIGNDILFQNEHVKVTRITGHGGLFKTPIVGQRVLAAALNSPISVMATAGEGGAWGIALLAAFKEEGHGTSLPDWLDQAIFAGNEGVEIQPVDEDVKGFRQYVKNYQNYLKAEAALL